MSVTFTVARETQHQGRTVIMHLDDAPELNVSNRNAALILSELGFEGEDFYCGAIDADELLAKITFRQAFPSGIALDTIDENDGRFIDVGVSAEYVPSRLTALVEICEHALALSSTDRALVAWS